jgi:hypothetical protein
MLLCAPRAGVASAIAWAIARRVFAGSMTSSMTPMF